MLYLRSFPQTHSNIHIVGDLNALTRRLSSCFSCFVICLPIGVHVLACYHPWAEPREEQPLKRGQAFLTLPRSSFADFSIPSPPRDQPRAVCAEIPGFMSSVPLYLTGTEAQQHCIFLFSPRSQTRPHFSSAGIAKWKFQHGPN